METAPRLPVLFIDDEEENLTLVRLQLGDAFPLETATSGTAALALLERKPFGMVVTDERMPGLSGIDLLERMVSRWPEVGRVIVSAYGDSERLLAAINRGHAHEYLLKPWQASELRACIERGLAQAERRRKLAASADLAEALERDAAALRSSELVGDGMAQVVQSARRAAQSDATVLIRGETGTGKELVARIVHEASPRKRGPFVRLNCGALSEGVLESELFGHEQGAYTGAQRARKGRFELASGGTLFLDEIGDVSPKLQISLLRVLQEREVERVGGSAPIAVDVRVIAATHRDLEALVAAGTFRQDLYYRLNVVPIAVPPLRARAGDIGVLLRHFIRRYAATSRPPEVSPEALEMLSQYAWPGNVRELENLVQRALIMADREATSLECDDFFLSVPTAIPPLPSGSVRDEARDAEAQSLRQLLLRHGGNLARAARELAIPRTTLLGRARKYGLM